ncbi:MAG: hypothetical protein ACJ8DI_16010 [Ktedonobacteraceae bacterium]
MTQNATNLPLSTAHFAISRLDIAQAPTDSYTITARAVPGTNPNYLAFYLNNPVPTQQQAGLMLEFVVANYQGPALYTLHAGGEENFVVWVGTVNDFWDLKVTPTDTVGYVTVESDTPTTIPGIREIRGSFNFPKLVHPGFGGTVVICVGGFDVFLQRP